MTLSELMLNWPAIQNAFANRGYSLSLLDAEAIFVELQGRWQAYPLPEPVPPPVPVPVPVPVPEPPPPPPVEVTPYTADQITAFYWKYLGRAPESDAVVWEWRRDPNAEHNISTAWEAQQYAAAHAPAPPAPPAWPLHGTGTEADPFVAMDPTRMAEEIRASLAFFGTADDGYWLPKAQAVGMYSDGKWYHGWNRYLETRAEPGNTGSADPALGRLPAVHQ
jgi:hypothetical protein